MARLFFAIWPDEEAARALAPLSEALAARAAGRPVPRDKIHMTLAFLGEIAPERLEQARHAAAAARSAAFDIVLDHVGSFRAARVAWAGCERMPAELGALQARLARELRARDFFLEERPFAAHVTLARRIAKAIARAPMAPIAWKARECTLVRSEPGNGRYTVLDAWRLGG